MKVEYDGKYPNLCRGQLFITTPDGIRWDFGRFSLKSGGCAYFKDYDYYEDVIEHGPWTIKEWPKDFPEDESLRRWVLCEINVKIEQGCCGGCL